MANATRKDDPKTSPLIQVGKWTASNNDDVLIAAGAIKLILGFMTSDATNFSLNVDGTALTTATDFPKLLTAAEVLQAEKTGGTTADITVFWVELPATTEGFKDNQLASPVT